MKYAIEIFDDHICQLGESPLWHPIRQQLFWVDLPEHKLHTRNPRGEYRTWAFGEMASAAAWIDEDHLLLALETGLYTFNIETSQKSLLCDVEASNANNRSNDGRADPWGGFWISTMSKTAEKGKGAIYRWWRGELRQLVSGVSIPNGICFDRGNNRAYHADSAEKKMYRVSLDPDTGWPLSDSTLFIDWGTRTCDPDGAIVDSQGNIWIALWDAACVEQYDTNGELLQTIPINSPRPTCPAFGGEDFNNLYLTTAAIGLPVDENESSLDGKTLMLPQCVTGVPEPAVEL